MKKIRLTMHANCPSCKEAEEDIHHILNCEERAHKTNEIFLKEFKKNYKNFQDQENILDQIITSVRQSGNHMNSQWNLENQTKIGWDSMLKGFVTKEWQVITEKLVPKRSWRDTMSNIIVAIWKTWIAMWKHRKSNIDYNARYCTQVQDDNNKLSLQIIYTLCHLIDNSIQKVMKRNMQEHLRMHRDKITDWLSMYRQIIKNIIDEKDPDIWQNTREDLIIKYSQEE